MIIYFSGTGNSKYVAERLAEKLNDRVVAMEEQNPDITLNDGELWGLVFPTFFYELPSNVREFLQKLSLKNSTYTFLVSTCGASTGAAGEDGRRVLAGRGISLSAAFSVKMADNYTPMFDATDEVENNKLNEAAESLIDGIIAQIQQRVTGNHMKGRVPYFVRFLLDPVYNMGRKTAKFHIEDGCTGCGLCARKCPVKAIEIKDNKPQWVKERCSLCLRCLHHCPVFAIQYGNGKTKKHGQYKHPKTKI